MGRKIINGGKWLASSEATTKKFNEALSEVITRLYKKKGYTQATFAEEIHYTRTSLNAVLKSKDMKRLWKLQYLLLVAEALKTPLSTIIAAAEDIRNGREASLPLLLAGTAARSPERLEAILRAAVGCDGAEDDPTGLSGIVYSIKNLRGFAPWLYNAYIKGEISDDGAYDIIAKARDMEKSYEGTDADDYRPFWTFLKEGDA